MKYNFDEIIARRGSGSYKWDSSPKEDVLPMWVADMDFKTSPAIISAVADRVQHGVFGYVKVLDDYYDSVVSWFSRRHSFNISPEWILYTSGVVPALSSIVHAFARNGGSVVLQTPVYNCFFSSIRNNGANIIESPLVYSDGRYTVDYDDLERKVSLPGVRLFILCNPHNPAGRVWTREELVRMGEICIKHDVLVVSDEIHGELAMPGFDYIPFGSISDEFLQHSITCTSASKAFNIAGLQMANIITPNPEYRTLIDKSINIKEVCDVNPFGVVATIAAYNQSADWLDQLRQYLYDNYLTLCQFFSHNLPLLYVLPLEGTYLVWVDCSSFVESTDVFVAQLRQKTGLWITNGSVYGDCGKSFVRINIACPRSLMMEGLELFRDFYNSFVSE